MTHRPPPGGSQRQGPASRPFYWELDDPERQRLQARNLILEDEGYLAHEINRGRRLLDLPEDYQPIPDVTPDWEAPQQVERFSDAVAAILQVAVDAGFDPAAVCNAALATHQSVRRHSAAAITHRQ